MPRVDVRLLEVCEHQLARSNVIAVRAQEHVGQPQLFGHLQEVLRLMVLCSINDDDSVFSPVGSLLIQTLDQCSEVQLHHLRVRVSLS